MVLSEAFTDMRRMLKNVSPQQVRTCQQGNALLSYFNSRNVNKCPLQSLFSANFHIFMLFLVISLFKMPSKHSANMPSSASKCKKAVTCLTEKTCVLDKFFSGTSYSGAGRRLMLMSQQYILNKVSSNRKI